MRRDPGRTFAAQGRPEEANAWQRVQSLKPGTELVVETDPRIEPRRCFVFATGAEVATLDCSTVAMANPHVKRLASLLSRYPELGDTLRREQTFENDGVRIVDQQMLVDGQMVLDLGAVISHTPRENVLKVSRAPQWHGSVAAAVTCGVVGFVAGFYTAGNLWLSKCRTHCGVNLVGGVVALAALPLAGAWLGWHASGYSGETVVYVKP